MKAQFLAPFVSVLTLFSVQNSFAQGSVVCKSTHSPAVTISVAIGNLFENVNGDELIYGYKSHAKVQIQTPTTTQVIDTSIIEKTISTRVQTGSSFLVDLGASDKMYFNDVEIPGQAPGPVKGGFIYQGLDLPIVCNLNL